MIAGVIQDHNSILAPVDTVLVKLQHELPEEDFHDFLVGVALSECEVNIPQCVYSQNHRDPRPHHNDWIGVGGIFWTPLHPAEVTHVKPGLVNVEEDSLLLGEREKLDCKPLPKEDILD